MYVCVYIFLQSLHMHTCKIVDVLPFLSIHAAHGNDEGRIYRQLLGTSLYITQTLIRHMIPIICSPEAALCPPSAPL